MQITPATLMGELVDTWAVEGRTNVFGNVMSVIEMESETGVAGVDQTYEQVCPFIPDQSLTSTSPFRLPPWGPCRWSPGHNIHLRPGQEAPSQPGEVLILSLI